MENVYLIVEGGVIVNTIVADAEFAESIGALPTYDGAAIGETYSPPAPVPEPEPTDTLDSRVTALEEAIAKGLNLYEEDLGNG